MSRMQRPCPCRRQHLQVATEAASKRVPPLACVVCSRLARLPLWTGCFCDRSNSYRCILDMPCQRSTEIEQIRANPHEPVRGMRNETQNKREAAQFKTRQPTKRAERNRTRHRLRLFHLLCKGAWVTEVGCECPRLLAVAERAPARCNIVLWCA